MDPFSLILGLGSLAANQIGQRNSMSLALANLADQRRRADESTRLATATRTDAYGNTQRYDPATNTWVNDLTPTQQAIIKTGESEQLKSLTEDAALNRQKRRRMAKVGAQAGQDFQRARAGYLYDQPQSERAIQADLTRLIAQSKADAARGQGRDVTRQLIREGRGSLVPAALSAQNKDISTGSADTALKAREGAKGEYATRTQAHESKYGPALRYYASLMRGGNDAPITFSNVPTQQSSTQGDMAAQLARVLAQGDTRVGSAFGKVVSTSQGQKPITQSQLELLLKGIGLDKTSAPIDANGNKVFT